MFNGGSQGVAGIIYHDGEGNFRMFSFCDLKVNGASVDVCSQTEFSDILGSLNKQKMKKYGRMLLIQSTSPPSFRT